VAEPPHGGWFGHPRPAKGVAQPPLFFFLFLIFFFKILLFLIIF
jgi:hypothetical protein